jgi:hypothetical protein
VIIIFWVYVAVAIIGILLLLIMALSGGLLDFGADLDLDIGDFDVDYEAPGAPSALSLPVMLFTVTMIGAIGAILTFFDVVWYITVAIAVGGAIICAVGVFFLMSKVLTMMTANAVENIDRLKGLTGMVTVPIEAGKEGQVVFSSKKTGRFTVGATAKKDIPNDTIVVVTEIVGDIVEVKVRGQKKGGKKKKAESKRKK